MENYDVIIIGSGLGGLSAGALLSQKGKKVLVLEKHYLVGGYATNFKRKDFDFDVALHQIGGVNSTGFSEILKKAGVYDKLKFIKHKYLYEAIYPDFEIKIENGNGNKFKTDLIKLFPKESFGIKLWFFIMKYVGFQVKLWDFGQRNKIFFPFFVFFAPLLIPILVFGSKLKISTVLDFCTKNEKLQKIFMELIGYYGDNLDISAIYYLVPSYGYYFDGGYYVYGGGQAVSDAFSEVIKSNGGDIISSCEVEKILLEGDLAIGVKTKKGDFYAKNIISNASPFIVYENLLKDWSGSKQELEKLERFEIGPSLGSVYIGLNTTIENLNPKYKDSYIISFNETYDISFEKNHALGFTITSHNDNDKIPEGKTVLTVALFIKYSDWDNLSKEDYKKKKEEETEKLLKRLSTFFPSIRNYIEVLEFGTPKTMEKYTGNKLGSVYGFSQKIGQSGFDTYGSTTKIKNLYLSSAWSFGGGFEGVIRAGNEVIKKIK